MLYRNLETGVVWAEDEIMEAYENYHDESEYMMQFESFDEYIDDQICKGIIEPLE